MKRIKSISIPLIAIVVVLFSSPVSGQQAQFEVQSSPNVVGSGARALGVGGAFIAIADDATAASWNPAALIILRKPEAAVMFSYDNRERNGSAEFYDFNYLAASYPFTFFKRNMIVSFNYQRLFDFNSQFNEVVGGLIPASSSGDNLNDMGPYAGNPAWQLYSIDITDILVDELRLDKEVTGDIGAVAPAFAVQITPKISVGVTLNFWMDGVINDGYKSKYEEYQEGSAKYNKIYFVDMDGDTEVDGFWEDDPANPNVGDYDPGEGEGVVIADSKRTFRSRTTIETEYDFFGVNANLGLLVNATKHLTIGAVYKTPFTAQVDVTTKYDSWQIRSDGGGGWIEAHDRGEFDTRYEITFPATYGVGAAWRFNDKLTMALDMAYIPWQDFEIQEYENTEEKATSGFGTGGEYLDESRKTSAVNGVRTQDADIDGVVTARLGAEYLFILPKTIIPARLGLIYDPQPAQGSPDDYYGITVGTGVMLFNRLIFDIAYQYRWSDSATVATITSHDGKLLQEITGDVSQHTVLLSSIYHF